METPPQPPSQWTCLRADLDRYLAGYPGYPRHSALFKLRVAITEEAFWAIFWYRLGRWATVESRVPGIRHVTILVAAVMLRILRILLGISLSRHCAIGPGLFIGHFGSIWINPATRIGQGVSISNGATIGIGGTGALHGVPEIGDFVFVGPHATITGRVRVGDRCIVGANSLVVANVPDGATVLGVPARVLAVGGNAPARVPAAPPEGPAAPAATSGVPSEAPGPVPSARGEAS